MSNQEETVSQNSRQSSLLPVIVLGLIIAVVIQSVVILGLNKKLNQTSDKPELKQPVVTKNASAGHKKHAAPAPDPLKDDKDPFAWNMKGWDPFKEMHSMHDRINQMFGSAFNRFQLSDDFDKFFGDYAFSPDMNIEDKGDHFLVTMDLPGSEDSRIDVKVNGQTLTVSGTVQSETKKEDKGRILRQERRSGNFQRSVTLPSPVKPDKITTTNEKGVLHIIIPKETETSK